MSVLVFQDHGQGWEPRTCYDGRLDDMGVVANVQGFLTGQMRTDSDMPERILFVQVCHVHQGSTRCADMKAQEFRLGMDGGRVKLVPWPKEED